MKIKPGILFTLVVFFFSSCNLVETAHKTLKINPNSSKEERIAKLNQPVFCLSVIIPNLPNPNRRAIGTGFLVSENLLATAFHVKEDLDRQVNHSAKITGQIIAWKKFEGGEHLEFPLNLVAVDQDSDLALFSFDAEILKSQAEKHGIKPFPLADRLPNIGEEILSVGYSGLMEFPFNSLGNVSTIDKGEDIYADMTLMPGNSGGPLISMKTGEVFGVNIKVMTMGDGTIRLGIAKRISKLSELIAKTRP